MMHSLGTHDNRALAVASTPQMLLTQEVALFVLSRQERFVITTPTQLDQTLE